MKHTRFTIDDILSPDFGRQSRQGQHHCNNDFKKNDDDILHPEIADNNSRITSLLLFKTENHRNNLFLCSSCTDERTSGKLDLKNNNHLFKQCDKYETNTENRKRCSDRQLYGETEEQKSRVEVTCLSDKTSSNVVCSKTTFCSRNHTPKITALPDSGHGNVRRTSADRNRSVPESAESPTEEKPAIWPAWVYCTRYSDRPSAGPRIRKSQKKEKLSDEKRPRTAFTSEQLEKLKLVFETNRYLTEVKRRQLAKDLGLNEAQIKIWFQNKRAKLKKTSDCQPLAERLMAQGLYNHKTVKRDESA